MENPKQSTSKLYTSTALVVCNIPSLVILDFEANIAIFL